MFLYAILCSGMLCEQVYGRQPLHFDLAPHRARYRARSRRLLPDEQRLRAVRSS
jgi:hypothetical protein